MAEIRDDVRLAIVGDGVALKDVKNYIIENNLQNIVECFGYQKDVRPFYKVASATIICSFLWHMNQWQWVYQLFLLILEDKVN